MIFIIWKLTRRRYCHFHYIVNRIISYLMHLFSGATICSFNLISNIRKLISATFNFTCIYFNIFYSFYLYFIKILSIKIRCRIIYSYFTLITYCNIRNNTIRAYIYLSFSSFITSFIIY